MARPDSQLRRRGTRPPLSSVRLQNLRIFEDTKQIDFARANFIFGKNSSGKTTVLGSLLLLQQLIEGRSLTGDVPFSGPFVDFGSYAEAVHQGQKRRDVTLSFDCDFSTLRTASARRRRDLLIQFPTMRVTVQLHWNASYAHSQIASLTFSNPSTDELALRFTRKGPDTVRAEMWNPEFRSIEVSEVGELSFQTLMSMPVDLDPEEDYTNSFQFFSYRVFEALRSVTARIIHVGPFRDVPQRAYRTDQLVVPGSSTTTTLGLMNSNPAVQRAVRSGLERLGIARDISLTQPAPGYTGINVTDIASGRKDNLADVGFGVSQVMPIIAQIAAAPNNSLVLIEQPELHLHPETQAELVDVLIDLALERGVSLLVESHSESMLLRLRRKVARGQIFSKETRVYITDAGEVRSAPISEDGTIDLRAFPTDFFEEDWLESIALARESAERALEAATE